MKQKIDQKYFEKLYNPKDPNDTDCKTLENELKS